MGLKAKDKAIAFDTRSASCGTTKLGMRVAIRPMNSGQLPGLSIHKASDVLQSAFNEGLVYLGFSPINSRQNQVARFLLQLSQRQ